MINTHSPALRPWRNSFCLLLFATLLLQPLSLNAAGPPEQLQRIVDDFLSMENTSLRIEQVIDWRFKSDDDLVTLDMDIKAGGIFHVTLAAFGMEIFVTGGEMISINHARQQIIREDASPNALLDQLFVGGDLSDARFKKEKVLGDGSRALDFLFSADFSDWDRLQIVLDSRGVLSNMTLVDYDGNEYLISLFYDTAFEDFVVPDLTDDYPNYQIADLREER